MLLGKLKAQGLRIARLPGKQTDADYAATKAAMAEGFDFIHQASLCNEEMRDSASDGDATPRGLSIVVGSRGLTTGIAGTVQEAEQINRLCRITCTAGPNP